MATNLPWFRMYANAVDNEKLRLIAFEDRWHFVAILCLKRMGLLDEGDSEQLRDRKISVKLGLAPRDLAEVKRRLGEVRLIDENWQPIGWEAKQFESDSGAERTRRWRERSRARDVTVTSPKRHGDGGVTVSDPDPDPDSEVNPLTGARAGEAGQGNPIFDWHRVPGVNHPAFEQWLAYLAQIPKRVSPQTAVAMARAAAYWSIDRQPWVIQTHIDRGWVNIRNNVDFDEQAKGKRGAAPTTAELEALEATRATG